MSAEQLADSRARSNANLRPWTSETRPNPQNVTGVYHEARAMAAKATPEAMQRLIALMRSPDERVALIACQAIVDRGAGKPRDHAADERTARADLSMLTPEQRRQLAELLMRALGQPGETIEG